MIGVDLIGDIRRAYLEQKRPIKEIVRTLSVSRTTVRRVIRSQKTVFKYERGISGQRFKGLPSLHVATGQITGAALVMLPIAAITERFRTFPAPTARAWGAFAGIALLCTVLAYILYFRILATAGATNLLLVTFLLPITAGEAPHVLDGLLYHQSNLPIDEHAVDTGE